MCKIGCKLMQTSHIKHAGDRGSIPGRDSRRSLKQVVTAPLPNARQVSRVLRDYHYTGLPRVTVGVTR